MTPFPWAAAMRIGLGALRLAPDAFWRMTPRELAAAVSGLAGTGNVKPIERARFDDLRKRFPDTEQEHG